MLARHMLNVPTEIWSGGQTGVDRGALDAAMELGIPTGGWVPRGRIAEDGRVPDRYTGLRETSSAALDVRTRRNVRDTDATLILHFGTLSGGTAYTVRVAENAGRPALVIDLSANESEAPELIRRWLAGLPDGVRLNVAGPRASGEPSAQERARAVLVAAFDDPPR